MEFLYFIGIFVIVGVIMAIVGFIGNKVVDGAHNAVAGHKAKKRKVDPRNAARTESLASRYRQ